MLRQVLLVAIGLMVGSLVTTFTLSPPTASIEDAFVGTKHNMTRRENCQCAQEFSSAPDGDGLNSPRSPVGFGSVAAPTSAGATRCPASQFKVYEGVDFNQGAAFDLRALHRNGPGASRFPPRSFFQRCRNSDYSVLNNVRVNNEGLEAKHLFLARCMTDCLAADACSGFVVRGDVCYLKKFIPFLASMHEPELVSFVRVGAREISSGKMVPEEEEQQPVALQRQNAVFDDNFRSRVLFGVLGSAGSASERLLPALNTWLCGWDALILLEDDDPSHELVRNIWNKPASSNTSAPYVSSQCLLGKMFVFQPVPSNATVRSFNGAWKNLPLLRMMVERYGRRRTEQRQKRDWFAIVDDDTFVLPHNFNLFFNSVVEQVHNPREDAVSIGVIFTDGKTRFVQGGAGIFLSAESAHRIAANYTTCFEKCLNWAGDIRLGCCYPIVGIEMISFPVFFSVDIVAVKRDARPPVALIPVSFHQLKTRSFIIAAFNAEQLMLGRPLMDAAAAQPSPSNGRRASSSLQCRGVPSEFHYDEALIQQQGAHCIDPFVCAPDAQNATDAQRMAALRCTTSDPLMPVSWHAFSAALGAFGCA